MSHAAVLAKTSWDATATPWPTRSRRRLGGGLQPWPARSGVRHGTVAKEVAAHAADQRPPVVVIGAGPTGLSAAYHLGEEPALEENDRVGGWCRSIEDNGFTFDYAGHIMFSNDPYVHELYKMLLGDNVHWQDREAWIYSKNVYTRYPFQGALYGLPPESSRSASSARSRRGSAAERSPSGDDAWPTGTRPHGAQPGTHGRHGQQRRDGNGQTAHRNGHA